MHSELYREVAALWLCYTSCRRVEVEVAVLDIMFEDEVRAIHFHLTTTGA
jgi:hypothetical protein